MRARLLLAKMTGDTIPCVIGAVDETVWENWTDDDEIAWIRDGKTLWGIDYDTEFAQVVLEVSDESLVAAFATVVVQGEVSA
jgi:hypothetical protein